MAKSKCFFINCPVPRTFYKCERCTHVSAIFDSKPQRLADCAVVTVVYPGNIHLVGSILGVFHLLRGWPLGTLGSVQESPPQPQPREARALFKWPSVPHYLLPIWRCGCVTQPVVNLLLTCFVHDSHTRSTDHESPRHSLNTTPLLHTPPPHPIFSCLLLH